MSERGYLRIYKSPLEEPSILSVLIDGRAGEFLAWRNVRGMPCRWISVLGQSDDYFRIPPTGIFGVRYDADSYSVYASYYQSCLSTYGSNQSYLCRSVVEVSWPLVASIFNPDSDNNLLPAEIDRLGVAISVNRNNRNKNLVPGLNIHLEEDPWGDEVFHVIIGGSWNDDESRYIRDLMFGRRVAGGPPSDPVGLILENESGYTLVNVKATILNKIAVTQYAWLPGDDDPSEGYYEVDTPQLSGVTPHPLDQVVRMTSDTEPSPCRVVGTDEGAKRFHPFSEDGGTTLRHIVTIYTVDGWDISYGDTTRWENDGTYYNLLEGQDCFLRYDFGYGNEERIDCLGIMCYGIHIVKIYGSTSDKDDPDDDEWVLLHSLEHGVDSTIYVAGTYYDQYRTYHSFVNVNSYRHYKLQFDKLYIYSWLGQNLLPSVGRIELLRLTDEQNRYRNRPFVYIDQDSNVNPAINDNVESFVINFENVSGGYCDIKISGNNAYVINDDTGERHYTGKDLLVDGTTLYRFADTEPLAGLRFKISQHLDEKDYATAIVGNGSACFEIRDHGDTEWTPGGNNIEIEDSVSNEETFQLDVRCNIPDDIDECDEYPVEAILNVEGESDQYDTNDLYYCGVDIDDWYSGIGVSYGIRMGFSDIQYSGNQVRVKLVGYNGTEVEEIYVGIQDEETASFSKSRDKVRLSFDDGAASSCSFTSVSEEWSDWADLEIEKGENILISLQGTYTDTVCDNYTTSPSVMYVKTGAKDAVVNVVYDYPEIGTLRPMVVAEIEVRKVRKYSAAISLTCSVKQKLASLVHRANIVPTDIYNALTKIGITFGEYS